MEEKINKIIVTIPKTSKNLYHSAIFAQIIGIILGIILFICATHYYGEASNSWRSSDIDFFNTIGHIFLINSFLTLSVSSIIRSCIIGLSDMVAQTYTTNEMIKEWILYDIKNHSTTPKNSNQTATIDTKSFIDPNSIFNTNI